MRKTNKRAKLTILAAILMISMVFQCIPGSNAINQNEEIQVKYYYRYNTNSSEFSSQLTDVTNKSYALDTIPLIGGNSLDCDSYLVEASNVQSAVFNSTTANFTELEPSTYNISKVDLEETLIIPNDYDASFKINGNLNASPAEISPTSLLIDIGDIQSGDVEKLEVEDSDDLILESESSDERVDYDVYDHDFFASGVTGNGEITNILDNIDSSREAIIDMENTELPKNYLYLDFIFQGKEDAGNIINWDIELDKLGVAMDGFFEVYIYNYNPPPYASPGFGGRVQQFDIRNQATTTNIHSIRSFTIDPTYFVSPEKDVYIRFLMGTYEGGGPGSQTTRFIVNNIQMTHSLEEINVQLDFDEQIFSEINSTIVLASTGFGTLYSYDANEDWIVLDSYDWGENDKFEYDEFELNSLNPRLKMQFFQEIPFTVEVDYLNLTSFFFPLEDTMLNITYQVDDVFYTDNLTCSYSSFAYNDIVNFTFEAEVSSIDFENWDRDYNAIIDIQEFNATFFNKFDSVLNISFHVEYSLNEYKTPSEVELKVNSNEFIDTDIESGYYMFDSWQNTLQFNVNMETYAIIEVESFLSETRDLETITSTLIRDEYRISTAHDILLERIELINVEGIRHVYISGVDYGDDSVIHPSYNIAANSFFRLDVVLDDYVYKKLDNLYGFNGGTSEVKISGTFNEKSYNDLNNGEISLEIPSEFAFDYQTLEFSDTAQNTTYWEENFDDDTWDDSNTGKNAESTLTIDDNATFGAAVYNHSLDLTIQDDFAYNNLTRNETSEGLIGLDGNWTNTYDDSLFNYSESLTFDDFAYYQGTGDWDIVNKSNRESVIEATNGDQNMYVHQLSTTYSSGYWEFWLYREGAGSSDRISFLTIDDGMTGIFWIGLQTDWVSWWDASTGFEKWEILEAQKWYHFKVVWDCPTFSLYINDSVIFEDYGSAFTTVDNVEYICIQSENSGGNAIYVDAIGTCDDAGYSEGDNTEAILSWYNASNYTGYEYQQGGFGASDFSTYGGSGSWSESDQDNRTKVLEFSQADGWQQLAFGRSFDTFNGEDYWLEFWYKGDIATTSHDLKFYALDASENFNEILWIEDNQLPYSPYTEIPIDEWTHFRFHSYYDGNYKTSLYINQELVKTFTGINNHEKILLEIDNSGLDFALHAIGITGINGYEFGDNLQFQHRNSTIPFESSDEFDSDWWTISGATIEISGTQSHDGSNSFHYVSVDDSSPYPDVEFKMPLITPNFVSMWIYLADDSDDYTEFCIRLDDYQGSEDLVEMYFEEVNGGNRGLKVKNGGGTYYNFPDTNDWNFGTWYLLEISLDFLNEKFTLDFNGNSVTIDFWNDPEEAGRLRFFKGFEGGTSGKGSEVYIDTLKFDNRNYFNYTFQNPLEEVALFNFGFNVDLVVPSQPLFFYLNETKYKIESDGFYSYSLETRDAEISFEHTFNEVTIEITANYTALTGAYINVTNTFTATSADYLQDLELNFTISDIEDGYCVLESGIIIVNLTFSAIDDYSYNLTQEILDAGYSLEDFDIDYINVTFQAIGNNTNFTIDDITLIDYSLEIYVNGTKVGYDFSITVEIDSNETSYDIFRLADDTFDLDISTNGTWTFNETFDITKKFNSNLDFHQFTSDTINFTLNFSGGDLYVFIDENRVDYLNLDNYVYVEHEKTFDLGTTIQIDARSDVQGGNLLSQLTSSVKINDSSVVYQASFIAQESDRYYYLELPESLEIKDFDLYHDDTAIETSRASNTFYFTRASNQYDLFIANITIDPNFGLNLYQDFNNGTDANLTLDITADLIVENVSIFVDLSSFEIYMTDWRIESFDTNISQSENRILTFALDVLNESNSLLIIGNSDVPVANIQRYSIQPYQYLGESMEVLYYGYLEYEVYSRVFQVNTSQLGNDFVLDGVHYGSTSLNIDENGIFFCSGWGTGISSSYVKFTTNPINSISQTRIGNTIKVVINSSLPILEAWYVLQITDEIRRVNLAGNNITYLDYNDTTFIIQGLEIEAGMNVFYFNLRVINPIENFLFALPVIIVCVIIIIAYYWRKGKLSSDKIKEFFTIKKDKKKSKKRKTTKTETEKEELYVGYFKKVNKNEGGTKQ